MKVSERALGVSARRRGAGPGTRSRPWADVLRERRVGKADEGRAWQAAPLAIPAGAAPRLLRMRSTRGYGWSGRAAGLDE